MVSSLPFQGRDTSSILVGSTNIKFNKDIMSYYNQEEFEDSLLSLNGFNTDWSNISDDKIDDYYEDWYEEMVADTQLSSYGGMDKT